MASLRNLAISLLRMAGATNIAKVLRHCARIRFDFELLRCTLLIDLHPPKLRDYCICYHYLTMTLTEPCPVDSLGAGVIERFGVT